MEIEDIGNRHSNKECCGDFSGNGQGCCSNNEKSYYQNPVRNITKTWDEYYFNMANQVASNSKCLSRKIGAILVKDKTIIGTGYNGPPRGVPHCSERWSLDNMLKDKAIKTEYLPLISEKCPRNLLGFESGHGLEFCIAGHAERNALINSARMGICTSDTTMYLSCGIPCTPCMVEIINAGVKEVVVTNFKKYDEAVDYLIEHSGISLRMYKGI